MLPKGGEGLFGTAGLSMIAELKYSNMYTAVVTLHITCSMHMADFRHTTFDSFDSGQQGTHTASSSRRTQPTCVCYIHDVLVQRIGVFSFHIAPGH